MSDLGQEQLVFKFVHFRSHLTSCCFDPSIRSARPQL